MKRFTNHLVVAWASIVFAAVAVAGPFAGSGGTAGGGGGSGTVTNVSVTTANGVSGSVANSTTTPAISLTLGAITPSTVSTGTVTTSVINGTPTIATPTISGHPTIEGVTSTGATGTGSIVYSSSPTINTPTFVAPALGTIASGDGTNLTGTASGFTAGHVTTNANLTGDVTSSGNAATVVKINGTSLAGLATGILKNTTTTGVPSIATAPDFPTLNQSTTGSAATLTTPRAIAGHNFDGSAAITIACGDLSNGATGCSTATGTSGATIPLLNAANTWSGAQSFNSSDLILKGATSGTTTLNAAATAGSTTITLPGGTTDFSGTGGTSQVVKQTSSGGAFSVARLACADLSDSGAGCTGAAGATLGANTFTRLQTVTQGTANEGIVASTGYSLTGSSAISMFDLAGTLNTTGSPDVFALRITDTARGASTKFFNIYGGASGATSVFSIDRSGNATTPQLNLNDGAGSSSSFSMISANRIQANGGFVVNGNLQAVMLKIDTANGDVVISRDAAGIAQFSGATPATTKGGYRVIDDTTGSSHVSTSSTELTTLATGATTTATSGNLAAANSQIKAILLRVNTTITTAANFTVKVTGGNAFCQIGTATTSNSTLTSGTTYVMVPCAHADSYVSAATTLTYTTNVNPGAGAIRATVVYEAFTPPSS